MSDLQKFIELYKSVGIELKPDVRINGNLCLVLDDDADKEFGGCSSFFSVILFNENGKFIPYIRNRDNNCKDYKRKWWKFWIR